jgi:acetylornithine deacetylase/succinyl-diaminopimelate desuccinylase-like protein
MAGWRGRGSADSKSGAAIFCHITARLAAITGHLHGSLVLLFDVDEHTGGFGGDQRYFEGPDAPDDVAGVGRELDATDVSVLSNVALVEFTASGPTRRSRVGPRPLAEPAEGVLGGSGHPPKLARR